jgi:geranylgeranyl diphosphate synthase, type II
MDRKDECNYDPNFIPYNVPPDRVKTEIERYLAGQIPAEPRSLYDPVRASIAFGGKRARPILTALCAGSAAQTSDWLPAAVAVELLHTFTLVHDDIMDNASIRRDHPTVHVAFGVNAAILSGDVIIALATECLAQHPQANGMLAEFSIGFRGVCEGQALDKDFETRDDVSMADYLTMIELKTSRIFELAAALGAIVGGNHIEALRRFAREIGLAFQLQDDLLDLTGTKEFGKTIGGDILEGKRTALFVLAMDRYDKCSMEERDSLDRLRERLTTANDIAPIRELFKRLGVLEAVASMVSNHADNAMKELGAVADVEMRENFLEYSQKLLGVAFMEPTATRAGQ